MEEVDIILDEAELAMNKCVSHLSVELSKIRAGRANPSMLDTVKVDYYGTPTPLSQVANVNSPDGRTLTVQPWEKAMLSEIEKAILVANLGLNPMNNGESVIISIPPLTEERRKELVKISKIEVENAKVSVRNARKEANNEIKNTEVSLDQKAISEEDIQKLTNNFIEKIDKIYTVKEKEILSV